MTQTSDYIVSKRALIAALRSGGNLVVDLVYWNNELVPLGEALRRAEQLSGAEKIARRRDWIFVGADRA